MAKPAAPAAKGSAGKTPPAPAGKAGVPATQAKAGLPAAKNLASKLKATASQGLAKNAEDFAIPFLYIAQANSPQLKKQDGKFIKGLAQGDIFNNVTGEFWPTSDGKGGPTVLPCHFQRRFIRWAPRDSGEGIRSIHTPEEAVALLKQTSKDERKRDVFEDGDLLVNTAEHYVLIRRDDGSITRAVIAMSSTQLKNSKAWNTMMGDLMVDDGDGGTFNPATFAQQYILGTKPESNNDGEWHGWKLQRADEPVVDDDTVFEAAQMFSKQMSSGAVKANYASAEGESAGAGKSGGSDDGSF